MSIQINDYDLIKLVETYPILYDKDQSRGQKNAAMKDDAWRNLALNLNASERACITRWKSIRDRFGKELRRAQEQPGETVNWDMFQHLLFLKDHYKQGHANGDAFLTIKYDAKNRKRGRKRRINVEQAQNEDGEPIQEDDVDPEELIANQQLIVLVKEHPVLYDKYKIRDSKNLTLKHDAWREISDSMGISEEVCYKKWKKLRDRFAREYRYQKLNPERPVMWVYFQDLMFLEGHYRKGIPLPVETMKRKKKTVSEDPWGEDCPFECLKEEEDETRDEDDVINEDEYVDIPSHSLDDLILIPSKPLDGKVDVTELHLSAAPSTLSEQAAEEIEESFCAEPVVKLTNVISNIEHVLRQSQDCLKSLQHQNEQHKQQLDTNIINSEVGMLQKVHILLDGLNVEHRAKAERRIVQFLCECQIKSLNNEIIDDISSALEY